MRRKPNPELIDKDAPEADEIWFANTRPAKDVLPGLVGLGTAKEMLQPKRARSQSVRNAS